MGPFCPSSFHRYRWAHVAVYGPALLSVLSVPFRFPSSEGSCSSTWLGHAGHFSLQGKVKPFVSESRGHSDLSMSSSGEAVLPEHGQCFLLGT